MQQSSFSSKERALRTLSGSGPANQRVLIRALNGHNIKDNERHGQTSRTQDIS